jgi:hypothetical protein
MIRMSNSRGNPRIHDINFYEVFWNTNNFISLKECDTKFRRLDRGQFSNNPTKLCTMVQSGIFCDYHCLRPYDKYKIENERIYDALCKNNTHKL